VFLTVAEDGAISFLPVAAHKTFYCGCHEPSPSFVLTYGGFLCGYWDGGGHQAEYDWNANTSQFIASIDSAEIPHFLVSNDTSIDLCYVFISPSDVRGWGGNRLPRGARLEAGQAWAFRVDAPKFDAMVADCNGTPVAGGLGWERKNGNGFPLGNAFAPPDRFLEITNTGPDTICKVLIPYPEYSPQGLLLGLSRLWGGPIQPGERRIEFIKPDTSRVDIIACDGTRLLSVTNLVGIGVTPVVVGRGPLPPRKLLPPRLKPAAGGSVEKGWVEDPPKK